MQFRVKCCVHRGRRIFLASHQFVLRGDDGRNIDLPDLYSKRFANVGPDIPLFVGGVSYCGKTNKVGTYISFEVALRGTTVASCRIMI